MNDIITRLRTACSPESPLGKLCTEAADIISGACEWNFDINSAPRGKTVPVDQKRCSSKGQVTVHTEQFIPEWIWAACKDGKVYRTHWLPPEGKHRPVGRWLGLGSKEVPIAWQPYVVPAHPDLASQGAAA